MSEIATQIDALIARSLAPALKDLGCKKKARTFLMETTHCTQVVNVQASVFNQNNEGRFTLNLGVYFPEVSRIIEAQPIKTYPREYDCTLRERIGTLMPGHADHWWNITDETDLSVVESELLAAWTDHGRPWLTQVSNLDGAKAELIQSRMFFYAAGIALIQQQTDQAKSLLQQALTGSSMACPRLRSWGIKHNLLEPDES